jgi:cbb3-type cytochrome oxidase subunit 3
MSGTAATIFTATVGGLIALAVAYISYRAGRRQTSDQATVEHGQWLRGQRQ